MKRFILLILMSAVIGATALASAASIVIPAAAMADLHMSPSAQDVAPPACAGMGLSTMISGAGVITGTEGNDLIVGSAGNDLIDGREATTASSAAWVTMCSLAALGSMYALAAALIARASGKLIAPGGTLAILAVYRYHSAIVCNH